MSRVFQRGAAALALALVLAFAVSTATAGEPPVLGESPDSLFYSDALTVSGNPIEIPGGQNIVQVVVSSCGEAASAPPVTATAALSVHVTSDIDELHLFFDGCAINEPPPGTGPFSIFAIENPNPADVHIKKIVVVGGHLQVAHVFTVDGFVTVGELEFYGGTIMYTALFDGNAHSKLLDGMHVI